MSISLDSISTLVVIDQQKGIVALPTAHTAKRTSWASTSRWRWTL